MVKLMPQCGEVIVVITTRYAGILVLYGRRVAWLANKNVTICSQYKHLYKIEKGCIIYIVAAVALQARFGACEELLPNRADWLAPVRA